MCLNFKKIFTSFIQSKCRSCTSFLYIFFLLFFHNSKFIKFYFYLFSWSFIFCFYSFSLYSVACLNFVKRDEENILRSTNAIIIIRCRWTEDEKFSIINYCEMRSMQFFILSLFCVWENHNNFFKIIIWRWMNKNWMKK